MTTQTSETDSTYSFDGSKMPTEALPEKPTPTQQALLSQATRLKNRHLSCKGMIYGDTGTMKTTTGMKILQEITPPEKDILYFDIAEGWSVLQNYPELIERVIHVPYQSIEQLAQWADAIQSGNAPFHNVGAVLFDEYTGMHDEDLNWVVETRAAQMAKKKEFKDPFSPALPDYNAARIRSNKFVLAKYMRLNNVHLIFIGHEKEDKRLKKVPDMPDKAGKAIYQKLHFLYHASVDTQGKWTLQTTQSVKITAKNRINGIGSFTNAKEIIENYKKWGVVAPVKTEVKPVDETEDQELLKLLAD
jgi:hypothetical protein